MHPIDAPSKSQSSAWTQLRNTGAARSFALRMIPAIANMRLRPAVELRHRKIGRCFAQDLIRLAKLSVLPLQRSDPLTFVTREPRPLPLVALGLPHPLPQRLACAANLRRN